MMKRLLALLLALTLVFSMVPAVAAAEETQVTAQSGDMTITGSNSFGSLLSDAVAQEQSTGSASNMGYAVCDVQIVGNTAVVDYTSLEEANLVVAIYTEDNVQMLQSASTVVSADATQATVTFARALPEYFMVSAYLLDSYDFSPLCAACESPMYTQAMQELLASTVETYTDKNVLQLGESQQTNFAVYNDEVVQITYAQGVNTVACADDENGIYVIENADAQFTQMAAGTLFAYSYSDTDVLIARAASVAVDGTTVTVTGAPIEMEEVFSHVKLENYGTSADMVVDENSGDEGFTYLGYEESAAAYSRRATVTNLPLKFKLEKEFENKVSDTLTTKVTISGTMDLNMDVSFEFYMIGPVTYLDFFVDGDANVKISVEGELDKKLGSLPSFGFYPVPGIYIGFKPEVHFKVTGSTNLELDFDYGFGAKYINNILMFNGRGVKLVDSEYYLEGSVFFGVDFKPTISAISKDALALSLSYPFGIQATGRLTGTEYETNPTPAVRHTCAKCLDVSVDLIAEVKLEFQIFNIKGLKLSVYIAEDRVHLTDLYLSFDRGEVDWGECPHVEYRVTLVAETTGEERVSGAKVTLSTGEALGTTNSNGVLAVYLPEGTYTFKTTIGKDPVSVTRHVNTYSKCLLTNDPQVQAAYERRVKYMVNPVSLESKKIIDSGTVGELEWKLYANGHLFLSGNGASGYFLNTYSSPWYEYREKIITIEVVDGVTSLDQYLFCDMPNLTQVIIPDSVTYLGPSTFYNCTGLRRVRLPIDYTYQHKPFENCTNVTTIHYTEGKEGNMRDRTANYWENSGNQNSLEYQCREKLQSVYFDEGTKHIGSYAFFGSAKLATVLFSETISGIGNYAFYYCTELTKLELPAGVTALGERAFEGCTKLYEIKLNEGLTTIGANAFLGCGALTQIEIPDSVTYLGTGAFKNAGLTKVTLPADYTFENNPFEGCNQVESIHFTYGQSGKMRTRTADYWETDSCQNALEYQCREKLNTVSFADTVKSITPYAFAGCSKLLNVTLPKNLTELGSFAFADCTALQAITLPEGITALGEKVFQNCSSLKKINLSNVTSFGSGCLQNTALEKVEISDDTTYLGPDAFSITALKQVTLPIDYDFKTAAFSGAVNVVKITYTPGQKGIMATRTADYWETDYYQNSLEYACRESLTTIVLQAGVKSISAYAFFDCAKLCNVYFPASVTGIGDYAFSNCAALNSVKFYGPVPYISSTAFTGVVATAYYPDYLDWQDADLALYGGVLSWAAHSDGEPAQQATVVSETQPLPDETPEPDQVSTYDAVYGGEYTTELADPYILNTASFADLVPGAEYVLLAMVSLDAQEPLSAENLLYIRQGTAGEDGSLTFEFAEREYAQVSYVIACGASNKDLHDAQVTFPQMTADEELQAVDPVVVYDGVTLKEGLDYVVLGEADFTQPGTYTCYIRGIHAYTGLVECTYTVAENEKFDLAGMTMSLGNSLAANFVVTKADLEGDGHYAVITKEYADGTFREVTVAQADWQAYGNWGCYFTFAGVNAKEMTDRFTVDVYNADGVQVMNTYVRTIEDYCYDQIVLEEAKAEPAAKNLALYVDILKYGAAAQAFFQNYNIENLATARLNETQLAYGAQEVTMTDLRVKGAGYLGSTLSLKNEISMNFVFSGDVIGKAAYATVSFTDHYGNAKEKRVEAADFQVYNASSKYIIVDGMAVADGSAQITVTVYDAADNALSVNVDSVESYIFRMTGADPLYETIMKLATSAYNYFH